MLVLATSGVHVARWKLLLFKVFLVAWKHDTLKVRKVHFRTSRSLVTKLIDQKARPKPSATQLGTERRILG